MRGCPLGPRRSDRGSATLTREELDAYCHRRGIPPYISTSAKEGEGVEELIARMQALISWDEKPATVTTDTFNRIKDHVLALKENREAKQVIVSPQALRRRLEATVVHRPYVLDYGPERGLPLEPT